MTTNEYQQREPTIEVSGRTLLELAEQVDRSYWRSGVSTSAQNSAVAYSLVTPVLDEADVPIPLRQVFFAPVGEHLHDLFSNGHGKVTEDDMDRLIAKCRRSLPTKDKARAAIEDRGVLNIAGKGFWAQGVLHYLGEPQFAVNREPDIVDSLRYLLDRTSHEDVPVHERTRMLTYTIARWAHQDRHWRAARELSLPVVTPGSTYFGRNDIVLFRKGLPAIVIEIDSQPNERSKPKLEFAYRAGALAVWVRWNLGEAERPPRGVAVIDLTDKLPDDARVVVESMSR
jgi:hypothetical protein